MGKLQTPTLPSLSHSLRFHFWTSPPASSPQWPEMSHPLQRPNPPTVLGKLCSLESLFLAFDLTWFDPLRAREDYRKTRQFWHLSWLASIKRHAGWHGDGLIFGQPVFGRWIILFVRRGRKQPTALATSVALGTKRSRFAPPAPVVSSLAAVQVLRSCCDLLGHSSRLGWALKLFCFQIN